MAKSLFISPLARQDLIGIYHYTSRRYGETKAKSYLSSLDSCFHSLADGITPSRSVDAIHANAQRALCGQHVIYFTIEKNELTVLRVLHQRMDPARHLF